MTAEQYSRDYYERGVECGLSGYTNYHWRPEYSLPFASELKRRYLSPQAYRQDVLDFGCAKGFLVKAFRLLGVPAYGYDISRYAIENSDPAVRQFVSNRLIESDIGYSLIVAKDTLEHIENVVAAMLPLREALCDDGRIVVTVPLGDNNAYRIREYELDRTHAIREDEEWWIGAFRSAGLSCDEFYYAFPGAKDHWLKVHPHGNGTFVLRKQGQW